MQQEKYNLVNGTAYHKDTLEKVINVLERYRNNRDKRLRVYYGDTETGKDWMDQYDVTGYIGRSTGPLKVPLLIHNRRSMGGGHILDHCIVKITETIKPYRVLYEHPSYHPCI